MEAPCASRYRPIGADSSHSAELVRQVLQYPIRPQALGTQHHPAKPPAQNSPLASCALRRRDAREEGCEKAARPPPNLLAMHALRATGASAPPASDQE